MVRVLYFLVAAEVFLGGGGRLLEIGPVTVRMLLFTVALCVSVWLALHRLEEGPSMRFAVGLVLVFFAVHLPPSILGLLRGAEPRQVWADVQPILYWLIAPFFAFALVRIDTIRATAALIWVCGLLLAVTYLGGLMLMMAGAFDPVALYQTLNATGEFVFRTGSFVLYKAFLYLGIGLIFLVALRPRGHAWMVALVSAALILTLTRGYLLSAAVAVLLLLLAERRPATAVTALACAGGAIWALWVFAPAALDGLQDQWEISNAVRKEDMRFIAGEMTSVALLAGHGFGIELNDRMNIENTYLWILWKTGLVGVLFWVLPLLLCWRAYRAIPLQAPDARTGAAFFFSVILVYVQTATNPSLNNPIGLAFVLIALFALRRLAGRSLAAGTARADCRLVTGP